MFQTFCEVFCFRFLHWMILTGLVKTGTETSSYLKNFPNVLFLLIIIDDTTRDNLSGQMGTARVKALAVIS
jgi:hypothetical protein